MVTVGATGLYMSNKEILMWAYTYAHKFAMQAVGLQKKSGIRFSNLEILRRILGVFNHSYIMTVLILTIQPAKLSATPFQAAL